MKKVNPKSDERRLFFLGRAHWRSVVAAAVAQTRFSFAMAKPALEISSPTRVSPERVRGVLVRPRRFPVLEQHARLARYRRIRET
jgi:hypothetical protein